MRSVLLFLVIAGANSFCLAQEQEHLEPSERKFQSLVREPLTMYKGFFRGGVVVLFATVDHMFDNDGNKEPLLGNGNSKNWSFQPFIQYGITDRLQAEVSVPYVRGRLQTSLQYEVPDWDSVFTKRWTRRTSGIGDVDVAVAYQFILGDQTKPGLALQVTATFPTGEKNPTNVNKDNPAEHDAAPGYGEYVINPQLRLRKIMFPYAFTLFVGYKYFFPGRKILQAGDTKERPFKSGNMTSVSGAFNVHLNNWIVFRNLAEVYLYQPGESDGVKGDNGHALLYTAGLSFQLKQFRFDQIAMIPVLGRNAAADIAYGFIAMYTF